jgi:hypothetical protein
LKPWFDLVVLLESAADMKNERKKRKVLSFISPYGENPEMERPRLAAFDLRTITE